jgi:hypothetical protein
LISYAGIFLTWHSLISYPWTFLTFTNFLRLQDPFLTFWYLLHIDVGPMFSYFSSTQKRTSFVWNDQELLYCFVPQYWQYTVSFPRAYDSHVLERECIVYWYSIQ